MRIIITLLILSTISFKGFSQIKLSIKLNPGRNDTAQDATFRIFRSADSALVTGKAFSDTASVFINTDTKYYFILSAVGKKEVIQQVNPSKKDISFEFTLKDNVNDLADVVVVARKPLITQDDDKTVVDAEVLAESSTNAYEVLEKTPGVVVDQDGNVYLNSATPSVIQINGREMKLSAADLASLLKSLPANSIIKIEILRNPSAKYDAASSGGILNIVLKKGVKLGMNGSVNVGYFQGKYSTKTTGFNLNKGSNKVNSYLSYQFTDRNNFEELTSNRFLFLDTLLATRAYTRYPSVNHYIGGGIDLTITPKLSIGYDLRISLNNNSSDAVNDIEIFKQSTNDIFAINRSDIYNKSSSVYAGNNLSAKYKIDSLGSEWTIGLDYNYFNSDNAQNYFNRFLVPIDSLVVGNGDITGRKDIIVLQTDAVFKLKNKFTIEAGGKYNFSKSNNNSAYFNDFGAGPVADNFQTNRFKYQENISSLYLQIAKSLGGLTVKPGLRMETTDIRGNQLFPVDTSLSIKRTDFFPYVYLRHNLFKAFGFQLVGNVILRRSIRRPYYEALNPYPKYIDQYLFDVGNPNLRPQFTTNYEFNLTADDYPIFSVGLNETKDIFTNVTYENKETGIAYRTFDNLGKNREFYFRLVGGIPPGGKYFFYAGAQHNLNKFSGLYQMKPLEYTQGSWVFFMYHNLKASNSLTVSSSSFMRLRGFQNFYELESFGSFNLSVNKTVLNRKGNIILALNDIFRTNQYEFKLQQGGVNASGKRFNDTRRIGLTLRYNFGIRPKPETNNMFQQPAEFSTGS